MRKISKANLARSNRHEAAVEFIDSGPRHVTGSTITSWFEPPVVDLAEFFARPRSGGAPENAPADPLHATIGGATVDSATQSKNPARATVSLSDGTQITFATADRVAVVATS
jgi:hypothetical protein